MNWKIEQSLRNKRQIKSLNSGQMFLTLSKMTLKIRVPLMRNGRKRKRKRKRKRRLELSKPEMGLFDGVGNFGKSGKLQLLW